VTLSAEQLQVLSDRETYLYVFGAGCGTVTMHRSHNLRSPEARVYLSDARQLQLQLDEQQLDPSAFSEGLGLQVASQKITPALRHRAAHQMATTGGIQRLVSACC